MFLDHIIANCGFSFQWRKNYKILESKTWRTDATVQHGKCILWQSGQYKFIFIEFNSLQV